MGKSAEKRKHKQKATKASASTKEGAGEGAASGGMPVAAKTSSSGRDLSTQLLEYLNTWSKDRDSWKFSKVLQSWAIDNSLDSQKVNKDLFYSLLPYLATVQGGARDRLRTRCEQLIGDEDDKGNGNGNGEDEGGALDAKALARKEAQLKRAHKILKHLSESVSQSVKE